MDAKSVVGEYVNAINNHEVDKILQMIPEDHRFVDSLGVTVEGRDNMQDAWAGYFKMVPDYKIHFYEMLTSGDVVVLIGSAGGTYSKTGELLPENKWETPGAWRVLIKHGKVQEWRVFADNEPIRKLMRS